MAHLGLRLSRKRCPENPRGFFVLEQMRNQARAISATTSDKMPIVLGTALLSASLIKAQASPTAATRLVLTNPTHEKLAKLAIK
jgi:hypothetical protein